MKRIALCLIAVSSLSAWPAPGKGANVQSQAGKIDKVRMRLGSSSFAVSFVDGGPERLHNPADEPRTWFVVELSYRS